MKPSCCTLVEASSEVRLRKFFGIIALAIGLVCLPTPLAQAETLTQEEQDQETEIEEAEEEGPTQEIVGEITVTALKREEMAQDVPFSVSAQTEELLRERGAQTLEDVSANVASFTVQNLGPGQSQVAIRGVSAGQIVRDQPGVKEQVGIYLDESVISLSLFTPDIPIFDISRVEVLRGPQGTLFGSGSLSGTVRYISNQPEIGVSETVTEFNGNLIDDGDVGGAARVASNLSLGDSGAMRITAYYEGVGGYMDAVQPDLSVNEDVNSGTKAGLRWAFRFEPSERLTITPRLIYQEVEMDGWNRIDDYNILANPFTTTRPAIDLGERELFTQFEEPFTDDFLLADLNIAYDIGDMTLTSITSYTDRDVLVVRDATALTASVSGGTIGLGEEVYTLDAPLLDATVAEMITQELRLSGVADRWNWLVGVFYSTIDRNYGQSLPVTGFEDLSDIPTEGEFGASKDVLFFSDLEYEFDQLAFFGEATWSATDKLALTAGLRYYDFEENRIQTFDGIFAAPGTNIGDTTADGVAPRFIASYALTDTTNLNAQVSKGFRLGGINDPLNIPLCTPDDLATFGGQDSWDDETLWNYEIGSKTTFHGGRSVFNTALFYQDISDLQATVTAGSCSSRIVFNVPDSESKGIEIEWATAPTSNFDFAISASYIDAKLKSTLTSTDADGNVTVVGGIKDGNRLPTVPEFQGAAAATYQWLTKNDWLIYTNGIFQYVGSRYTQTGDQALGFGAVDLLSFEPNTIGGPLTQDTFFFNPELPSYQILNLRIGLRSEWWDIALFLNNVTDERAFLALDQERGTRARVGYLTNPPRTLGINWRMHF